MVRAICFLVFVVPGAVIVGYAVMHGASSMELSRAGLSEVGEIVDYQRQDLRRLRERDCAVIEFDHAGTTHVFVDGWCNRSPKDAPVGTAVAVVFDAGDPARARIDAFGPLYGRSLFIGVIGLPWLLLGIALVVRVR